DVVGGCGGVGRHERDDGVHRLVDDDDPVREGVLEVDLLERGEALGVAVLRDGPAGPGVVVERGGEGAGRGGDGGGGGSTERGRRGAVSLGVGSGRGSIAPVRAICSRVRTCCRNASSPRSLMRTHVRVRRPAASLRISTRPASERAVRAWERDESLSSTRSARKRKSALSDR